MKKTTMVLCAGIMAVSLLSVGCGGKYSDVKKVNGEFSTVVKSFSADIEKVENAGDAAKALNKFADNLEELMPKMQALSDKYPELEDETNLPEELQELQAETEEAAQKMVGNMMKLMNYLQDPEVMKAQQRLSTIMQQE
jgi:predicted nuclease with TOPRIM domain